MQRRHFLATAATLATGALAGRASAANSRPVIEVWKTPTCGCCHDWIAHLQSNGFDVMAHDVSDATKRDYRLRLGLADKYGSCHTALVNGYVLEGHVPAREIRRLLREKPVAIGLAVPGMPVGSPGMDGPAYGGRRDAYDVLLVQRGGAARVYQAYR